MSKWVGFAVSVNCGDPLGCYQGTILEADGSTITLTKAFRNGFPYPKSQVTLNAADIKDLRIIETRPPAPPEQTHSTVAISKSSKKAQRATVCENLQANPTSSSSGANPPSGSGVPSSKPTPASSKPIDIQGPQPSRSHKASSHASGSYGWGGGTPKGRWGRERRRNEDCFGEAAEGALDDDYDFEGNLALFDKRAEWERLRLAQRPDLVRQADDRFRPDENVLGGHTGDQPKPRRALRLPDHLRGPLDYVTDEGMAVAAVAPVLRRRLRERLIELGLVEGADALLARAAADVALRLVGGGRRLEARNAHQAPTVVALAGPHRVGAAGLLAARLLASHGARAAVLVPREQEAPALRRELAAFALGGVRPATETSALPRPDVVLVALYDPALDDPQDEHTAALAWVKGARAAVVAMEPPAAGWDGLAARAAVVAVAPCALPAALGRVFLADVAPPVGLFAEVGGEYRPPFGAAPLLALHPADD